MPQSYSEFLQTITKALEAADISYMIVGSVASMFYGEARMTRDLDVVIAVETSQVKSFVAAFDAKIYYVPPYEILVDAFTNRGMFNLIHLPSAFKVDLVVQKRSAHSAAEFIRRRRVDLLPGLGAFIGAPEDIIIKKLVYFREGGSEKHLRDIQGILARTSLDRDYIEHWVQALALSEEWSKVAPAGMA